VNPAATARKQSARPGKGVAQLQDLHATQASDSEAGFVVVHVSSTPQHRRTSTLPTALDAGCGMLDSMASKATFLSGALHVCHEDSVERLSMSQNSC
jgi:hypothetical protein